MFQLRFVFAVICLTVVFLAAIFLREANNRVFYDLCTYRAELNRLKQQLGAKQIRLEAIINPAAVSQQVINDSIQQAKEAKLQAKAAKPPVNKSKKEKKN
jgi:hypothetical protein